MAVAVQILDPPVFSEFAGSKGFKRARVTFDASYVTGGEPITAADFGLGTLDSLQITGVDPLAATTNVMVTWDRLNSKLMAFHTGAAVATPFDEDANATDLSGLIVDVLAYGRLL